MIGFNTNVLLRLIVKDDPSQTKKAINLLRSCQDRGEPILITDVTLCETIWTLRGGYHYAKPKLLEALEQIADTVDFLFEEDDSMDSVVRAYGWGKATSPII